jgi:Ca2+-binding RTX toxin-like protein
MAFVSVDPRGTYLNVAPTDAANAPTTVLLATLGLVPGDVITLSRSGAYKAGEGISSSGFPFTDASTSMLAVFSGAAGLLAPDTYLGFTSPLQGVPPNLPTDVAQDFFVVGPGVTTLTIPAGAISIKFSPSDSFFQDNTDPNGDYGVEVRKLDGTTSFANTDLIYGTPGADSLLGGFGNDTLWGGAGDDTLRGQEGADSVYGGAGNDTLDGGVALDHFFATDLNFTSYFYSTAGVNINLAGITGDGSTGSGTATGDASVGTDTLINISLVQGSNFNDTITGSTALIFEQVEGGAGDDLLDGGLITDTLNGDNNNRLIYQNTTGAGVTVDFIAGTAVGAAGSNAGNDTFANFNQVRGSNFSDTLLGSDRTDVTELFDGRNGNDSIDGRGGFDQVGFAGATGGVTVNLVTGTSSGPNVGSDVFFNIEGVVGSSFDDSITGGNAANGTVVGPVNELLEVFRGGAGNDTIDGGQGYDVASYLDSPAGVVAKLNDILDGTASDGFGGTDVLRSIEGLRGSTFNDSLTGSDTAAFESFRGLNGDDTIDGLGGRDRVDYFTSRAGVNVNLATGTASDGYGNTDTLRNIEDVQGSRDFNDTITGSIANNKIDGLGGNDSITGDFGFDLIDGGDGDDFINGGFNGDTIFGGAGNDFLGGGNGKDVIDGGSGNDTLRGGFGADTLTGGSGNDRFQFLHALDGTVNVDTLLDFTSGQDVFELSAAIFTVFAGQVGNFVSTSANLTYDSGTGVLAYDADGAGPAAAVTFAILGVGVHTTLLGNDFLIVA